MPIVLGTAMTIMKPGLMMPFLKSLTGILCIAGAISLVICGWLVIRKITRIDV